MLILLVLNPIFAVSRVDPNIPIPEWAVKGDFFSITKTKEELSIVCEEENIPTDIQAERGWLALKVEGPLDFSLTGILSSLLTPLARASISIFALSTYDTDYLFVKKDNFEKDLSILGQFCKILRR